MQNGTKKYKIVILVIASGGNRYDEFLRIWKMYDKLYSEVKVFYVFGDGHIKNDESEIVANSAENYIPGILLKTIFAMQKIHDTYEYDFLLRTNLSSFFVLPKLMQFVDTLPKIGCYAGMSLNGRSYVRFISGAGIIMSRDVISLILQNEKDLDCAQIDDYSLGKFMMHHRVPIRQVSVRRVDDLSFNNDFTHINTIIDNLKNGPAFHFRLKALEKRYRKDDSIKMQILYNKYYQHSESSP